MTLYLDLLFLLTIINEIAFIFILRWTAFFNFIILLPFSMFLGRLSGLPAHLIGRYGELGNLLILRQALLHLIIGPLFAG